MERSHLEPGAHVSTPRLGYRHHGLYGGDGRVLHFGGRQGLIRRGPVEVVTLAQFTRGHGFAVHRSDGARFAGAAALERARSRIGAGRYRVWSNNCEHFVHWCLSGQPRSPQVEAWRGRLGVVQEAWLALSRGLQSAVVSFSRNPAA